VELALHNQQVHRQHNNMREPQTSEEVNEAISDYTNLLNHSGWKRVVVQLDANIEFLQGQLENGLESEKYDDVKRLRDKLTLMREMRDTPQNMINRLQSPDPEPVNTDPFDTKEDVANRKKQEVDKEAEE
jgi:hypothetical protein